MPRRCQTAGPVRAAGPQRRAPSRPRRRGSPPTPVPSGQRRQPPWRPAAQRPEPAERLLSIGGPARTDDVSGGLTATDAAGRPRTLLGNGLVGRDRRILAYSGSDVRAGQGVQESFGGPPGRAETAPVDDSHATTAADATLTTTGITAP